MARGSFVRHIATLGPVGFSPFAPGTVGTLVTAAAVAALRMPPPIYLAATIAVIVIGTIVSGKAEEALGEKDPGCIVIDEVAGYMICMAFLPLTMGYLLASFFLFRALDVLKPPPINRLQDLKGGVGVMADDLAAGLITNLALQAWRLLT
jgi:phosphatidylglycerophosphatase A